MQKKRVITANKKKSKPNLRYQVIEFKSDYNTVLNKSGNGGRIQIKTGNKSDLQSIKKDLRLYGLELETHQGSETKAKL